MSLATNVLSIYSVPDPVLGTDGDIAQCPVLQTTGIQCIFTESGSHLNWFMKVKLGGKRALVDVLNQAGLLERQETRECFSRNRPPPARAWKGTLTTST